MTTVLNSSSISDQPTATSGGENTTPILLPTKITTQPKVQSLQDLLFSGCLETSSSFLDGDDLPWNLFVVHEGIPALYSFDTNKKVDLNISLENFPWNYFISPDGKWVAYQNNDQTLSAVEPVSSFLVGSSEGQKVRKEDYHFLEGWFSKDSLLITHQINGEGFFTTVIWNPFTEKEHVFRLEDLPDYKTFKSGGVASPNFFGHGDVLPDPTLTRLVYPQESDDMIYLALWNIENNSVVAKLDYFYESWTNNPLWSSDGSDFLIMDVWPDHGIEWYQITRNGDIKRITNFNSFLKSPPVFSKASRSWDGKYLAFQIEYDWNGETDSKYIILDLHSEVPQGFCINALPSANNENVPPVWSPDSHFLAISNTDVNGFGELLLVDIQTRKLYNLATDSNAIGWIVKPN